MHNYFENLNNYIQLNFIDTLGWTRNSNFSKNFYSGPIHNRHSFELWQTSLLFLCKNVAHILKCQVETMSVFGQDVVVLVYIDRHMEFAARWHASGDRGLKYRFDIISDDVSSSECQAVSKRIKSWDHHQQVGRFCLLEE